MTVLSIILLNLGLAQAETVQEAYPPPSGSQTLRADAFGSWLQELEMLPQGSPILAFDGREIHHRGRPIDLGLVRGDLQQCADSAIRLRAEWLKATNAPVSTLSFYATSGDPLPWQRFLDGERPYATNNRIHWREESNPAGWEEWLRAVFTWAGTRSLAAYETIPVTEPRAGDLLVEPGSPGHAVVILNVATRGDRLFFLLGEGYMPAQQFHVEHGPHEGWWEWKETGLRLPAFHMGPDSLRRWKP